MKLDRLIKSLAAAAICVVVFILSYTVISASSSNIRSVNLDTLPQEVTDILSQQGWEFSQPEIKKINNRYTLFYGTKSDGDGYAGYVVKSFLRNDYLLDTDKIQTIYADKGMVTFRDSTVPFTKATVTLTPEGEYNYVSHINYVDVVSCIVVFIICFVGANVFFDNREKKKAAEKKD